MIDAGIGDFSNPAQKHTPKQTIKHPNMKTHHHYCSRLFLTAVLTGSCLLFISASQLHAQKAKPAATPAVDPATHAAHVAAGTMPAAAAPDAA